MPAYPEILDLIDGAPRAPRVPLAGTLDDPNTGEALAERRATDDDGVERALARADALHRSEALVRLGVAGRAALLERLAVALEARTEAMAPVEALDTGIPITVTRLMTGGAGSMVRGAIAALEEGAWTVRRDTAGRRVDAHRLPLGPALVLVPWNAPAAIAISRTAAALAVGCPVLVKPSEWAPGTCAHLVEAALEAELPAGALQVVHGDGAVGGRLVSDARVRAITLTGGIPAGAAVARAAAPNMARLQLELGGSNAAIVRADADLAVTAHALARGMTKLNGQWCEAPRRVLVPDALHDELVERLLAELAALRVGSSLDDATEVGPLSHAAHRGRVRAQVAAAVAAGGSARPAADVPEQGTFEPATVITGLDAAVVVEEIFGPAIALHRVADDEAALRAANAGEDGLAGYVFSEDIEAALALGARIRAGEIKVNGTGLLDLCPGSTQSFWGRSGYGGHGDPDLLRFFTGARIVGVDDPSMPI